MAAKDYRICCALFNAYIGKTSKRSPNLMTEDRRVIPESEILQLIHWWVKNKLRDKEEDTQVITFDGEPILEIKLLNKEV